MAAELEHPRQASDLYIVLGAPVDPYRPYMTGDVFQGIAIPGVEDAESEEAAEQLAMITTHPCSMRDGAKLKSHVEVRRVVNLDISRVVRSDSLTGMGHRIHRNSAPS
jgi:hypothetical protein